MPEYSHFTCIKNNHFKCGHNNDIPQPKKNINYDDPNVCANCVYSEQNEYGKNDKYTCYYCNTQTHASFGHAGFHE
jgi:hypothetical protein